MNPNTHSMTNTTIIPASVSARAANIDAIAAFLRKVVPDRLPAGPANVYTLVEAAREAAGRLPPQRYVYDLVNVLHADATRPGDGDLGAGVELVQRIEREIREHEAALAREAIEPELPKAWADVASAIGFELPGDADADVVVRALRLALDPGAPLRQAFTERVKRQDVGDDALAMFEALGGRTSTEGNVFSKRAPLGELPEPSLPNYQAANVWVDAWLTPIASTLGIAFARTPREMPFPPRTANLGADQNAERRVLAQRAEARAEWARGVAATHRELVSMLDELLAAAHAREGWTARVWYVRELRRHVAGERVMLARSEMEQYAIQALRSLRVAV
ncbi:MAG: hypothetical protein SFX73_31845 [Kofleriaceae bacterium]|nr:hypothetical protein [Kofleriaceae bacterium]